MSHGKVRGVIICPFILPDPTKASEDALMQFPSLFFWRKGEGCLPVQSICRGHLDCPPSSQDSTKATLDVPVRIVGHVCIDNCEAKY